MAFSQLLDTLITIYGVYLIFSIIVRPPFFWESRRMQQRRALIGDRNTIIIYLVIGLLLLGLGGAGFMGFL